MTDIGGPIIEALTDAVTDHLTADRPSAQVIVGWLWPAIAPLVAAAVDAAYQQGVRAALTPPP